MIDHIIIWITFALTITSSLLYFISARNEKILQYARYTFYAGIMAVAATSALLWLYLLGNRFEYQYVYNHSSRDLSPFFLITSFWAGQEGSFLLWTLFSAIIGFFLCIHTRRKKIESESMTIYSVVLSFMSLLVLIKSPFKYVWDSTNINIMTGSIPIDGKGLPPMLHNFWMIIHPPLLLLGFAILAVPYVIAISTLWKNKYKTWTDTLLPWVLLGSFFLGCGIAIGGYWAYGTVGWGGWWGWDPVENLSLILWLLAIIFIYTIIIQERTGKFGRINFIIAILIYCVIIYNTFLVRSGLLAGVSIHSYLKPDMILFALFLTWLIILISVGLYMIVLRRKNLRWRINNGSIFKTEPILAIAIGITALITIFIFSATNISWIFNVALEPSLYSQINLPLATLVMVLLGVGLLSKQIEDNRRKIIKSFIIYILLVLIIGTVILIFVKVVDTYSILIISVSISIIFIAIRQGYVFLRNRYYKVGSIISYAGLGILFIGIIVSENYEKKQVVLLTQGQTQSLFHYNLTYKEIISTSSGRDKYIINIEYEGKQNIVRPAIFKNHHGNIMRIPDYLTRIYEDIYFIPIAIKHQSSNLMSFDSLVLEVTIKPFMVFIWIGITILLLGILIVLFENAKE